MDGLYDFGDFGVPKGGVGKVPLLVDERMREKLLGSSSSLRGLVKPIDFGQSMFSGLEDLFGSRKEVEEVEEEEEDEVV